MPPRRKGMVAIWLRIARSRTMTMDGRPLLQSSEIARHLREP